MNYRFANIWLKGFRTSPEVVCKLYHDDFLFEDLMLDQSITDKDELHRVFAPYANTDPGNGIGIHNFTIESYTAIDDHRGIIHWAWEAKHTAVFLGLPTEGKTIGTKGQTFHVYEDGRIKRESTFWDAAPVLKALGHPIDRAPARLASERVTIQAPAG
jgi:steroid delta-isomerase-like uncharacterized protein